MIGKMPPIEFFTAHPEYLGLLVAMGGLAFQEWQIRVMRHDLNECNTKMRESLEARLDRHWVRIEKLSDEILNRTDIKGEIDS